MTIFHSQSSSNSNNSTSSSSSGNKIKILTDSQKEQDKLMSQIQTLINLRSTAYNNLAAAQMKVDAMDQALKSVTSSLEINPLNVKALYRKSKILSLKGELTEAIDALKQAMKIEPESKTLSLELTRLANLWRKQHESEKKMYQKMLDVDPSKTPNIPAKKSSSLITLSSITSFFQDHPAKTSLFLGLSVAIIAVVFAIVFLYY